MSLFGKLTRQINISGEKKKPTSLKDELKASLQENMTWAREEYPDDLEVLEKFFPIIAEKLDGHIPAQILEEDAEEIPEDIEIKNAVSLFHISDDKMKAFICVLPPVNGGDEVQMDALLKDLRYTGISYGIDQVQAKKLVAEKDYLRPLVIAVGTSAQDGKDGQVTELFERKEAIELEAPENAAIDFSQEITMQTVQKDAIICRIEAATKMTEGKDVVGNVLSGADGTDAEVFAGPNTYLSSDGKHLLASEDGVISITKDGHFCVKPQRTVMGDAGRHTGNLYAKGDLYISGNVTGDIVVKADGDLIIGGEVRAGEITAGGNLRIQKGASNSNEETIRLSAGGQLQCAVLDGVTAEAEGNVYAAVMMHSDVLTQGSVYVVSDRGLIIGGSVKAHQNVGAKEIGNLSECKNAIWVGYDPHSKAQVQEKKDKLKEINGTLEMLQRNIANLKALGSRLPEDKKELLEKLVEQRELYEANVDDLEKEIKQMTIALRKADTGKVTCETMYPTTEIQIGEKKTVIQRQMSPCSVFVQSGNIVAR